MPLPPWNPAPHLTHARSREQEVSATFLASLGLRGGRTKTDEQRESTRVRLQLSLSFLRRGSKAQSGRRPACLLDREQTGPEEHDGQARSGEPAW